MSYLDSLESLLSARLKTGAIGKVVFVRAHLQLTADHGLLVPIAAAGVELATHWAAASVRSVYPQGGPRQGLVSLLLDLAGGQSALVSAESSLGTEASVQLLITGQHGCLRYDDYPEPAQLAGLTTGKGARWVREIGAALAAGRQIVAVKE